MAICNRHNSSVQRHRVSEHYRIMKNIDNLEWKNSSEKNKETLKSEKVLKYFYPQIIMSKAPVRQWRT